MVQLNGPPVQVPEEPTPAPEDWDGRRAVVCGEVWCSRA
jgi:hypothetical protein